jgi:hypothetical protein
MARIRAVISLVLAIQYVVTHNIQLSPMGAPGRSVVWTLLFLGGVYARFVFLTLLEVMARLVWISIQRTLGRGSD